MRVLAVNNLHDPGQLLTQAILQDDDPVLFIENKILYSKSVLDEKDTSDFIITTYKSQGQSDRLLPAAEYAPTFHLQLRDAPEPQLTIVTYGYMTDLCRQAALQLAYEEEIFVDLVIMTQLSPFKIDPIFEAVRKTHQLLIVEEGTLTMGWGAEILARSIENFGDEIFKARRVASLDSPIPASQPLEISVLPDLGDIINAVKLMV